MSGYHIANNQLRTARILSVKTESPTVKTFCFKDKGCMVARPGQFLMLWVPGVDEIPLSILQARKNGVVSVAVKNVGEATQALHGRKVGDLVGVRGPFGNNFTLTGGKALIVGGGTATAPLLFLARELLSTGAEMVFVQGAKTKAELLFMNELEDLARKAKMQLTLSTEDGSCGITGLCTEPLEKILAAEEFEMIYACGPEPMISKVFELAEKKRTPFEASLERLMRCAIGLCGSCAIGRYRVCKDGPVFSSGQLREVATEFGVSKRDFDGRKMPVC